jgi:hypothetical protein
LSDPKVYLGIQHDFWSSVPARCNVFRQTSGVVVIGIRDPKNKNKIGNFWAENSHLESNIYLMTCFIKAGVVSFY